MWLGAINSATLRVLEIESVPLGLAPFVLCPEQTDLVMKPNTWENNSRGDTYSKTRQLYESRKVAETLIPKYQQKQ